MHLKLKKLANKKLISKQKRSKLPSLIFITDVEKVKNIFMTIENLPKDTLVIIRDYNHPEREIYAEKIAAICKKRRLKFLVAGDLKLAKKLKANGVHLREDMAKDIRIWRLKNSKQIITISAHSASAIQKIQNYNVDAILLSPVFPTSTHPCALSLGIKNFKNLSKQSKIPVYALGGVDKENVEKLEQCNIAGIAGIDMFR